MCNHGLFMCWVAYFFWGGLGVGVRVQGLGVGV